MQIRYARPEDTPAIWAVIGPAIRAGETYALDRDMSEQAALAYWLAPDRETFVAEEESQILGTYFFRPNQAGGGNHVGNCGYITGAGATGRGVARAMCLHSLDHARAHGYRACNSISSSAPMNAPSGCGSRSASKSSAACPAHFATLLMAMSTLW